MGAHLWAPPPPPPLPTGTLSPPVMALPTRSEHTHAACSGFVTKGPALVYTRGCPFTMYLLSPPLTYPLQLQNFLSIALFACKHDLVPT